MISRLSLATMPDVYAYMDAIHKDAWERREKERSGRPCIQICMHACVHVCMYIRMYRCIGRELPEDLEFALELGNHARRLGHLFLLPCHVLPCPPPPPIPVLVLNVFHPKYYQKPRRHWLITFNTYGPCHILSRPPSPPIPAGVPRL